MERQVDQDAHLGLFLVWHRRLCSCRILLIPEHFELPADSSIPSLQSRPHSRRTCRPVKPWKMARVCLPILRFDQVSEYFLAFLLVAENFLFCTKRYEHNKQVYFCEVPVRPRLILIDAARCIYRTILQSRARSFQIYVYIKTSYLSRGALRNLSKRNA